MNKKILLIISVISLLSFGTFWFKNRNNSCIAIATQGVGSKISETPLSPAVKTAAPFGMIENPETIKIVTGKIQNRCLLKNNVPTLKVVAYSAGDSEEKIIYSGATFEANKKSLGSKEQTDFYFEFPESGVKLGESRVYKTVFVY